MKKVIIALIYLVVIVILFLNKKTVLNWIEYGDISIVLMVIILILAALFPVIPFGVVGAIAGVKFGVVTGALLNVSGSTIAALIMFYFVKTYFRTGYKLNNQKAILFKQRIHEHAFLSIVLGRMIPVIPAYLVNILAALLKVKLSIFLTATIIGKLPTMFIFAFIGDQAFNNIKNTLLALSVYLLFLAVSYYIYKKKDAR